MRTRENNYKKANYKIGDKLQIIEHCHAYSRYIPVEIITVIDKGSYNMYLCKNLISNCKITFTDKEVRERLRRNKFVRGDKNGRNKLRS